MNQDKTSHLSRSTQLSADTGLDSGADGLPIIADRYSLLGELGIGGMGKVFLARDRENGDSCAIKLMHNHLSGDSTSRLRFEREARLALGLNHQNIVRVTDFGVTKANEPFMVMEFLVGESLQDLLKKHGRLPLEKFLPIFDQVCAGLQFAHDSGVVHRDMKPSNIMLIADTEGGAKGMVKIVDFGIARVCKTTGEICPSSGKEIEADAIEAGMKLTQPGEVFGSPLYMSPEQCFGEDADCRSEVYSLGCMMFETLTGDAPLRGKNAMDTMLRRVHEIAPSLSSACPEGNFPEQLDNIISRCLKRDPDDRFQNVAELAQALSTLRS